MTAPTHRPARRGAAASLLPLAVLSAALAGCAAPSRTIRELGQPAFEEVVGAETRFTRADPHQVKGLDAYTEDLDEDARHTFLVRFWPLGSEEEVLLRVTARPSGGLPLERLAAAVYPISREESQAYGVTGVLPRPDAPLVRASDAKRDKEGNLVLDVIVPRSAIPPGTERLAMPTLTQFTDGWIHVRYYHTAIPEPIPTLTPEEVDRRRREMDEAAAARAREHAPAGPGTPAQDPAPPPAVEPRAPESGSGGEDSAVTPH